MYRRSSSTDGFAEDSIRWKMFDTLSKSKFSASNLLTILHIHNSLVVAPPANINYNNGAHSVESPSMVDPQWDIWYWGSKWNLHTVCWSAVGCERGTTSVYFGITYACFIPSRLPVFAVELQYLLQDFFIFVKSIIWRTHTKSSKNFMLV